MTAVPFGVNLFRLSGVRWRYSTPVNADPLCRTARDQAMLDATHSTVEPFIGSWVLLFPATYLAHIAEEYWGGFPARFAGITGLAVPDGAFLGANALFWVLMATAAVLVLRRPTRAPLVVALATVVTINATLHLGGTVLNASYSPGLITGVLLWLPPPARCRRARSRTPVALRARLSLWRIDRGSCPRFRPARWRRLRSGPRRGLACGITRR